MAREPGGAAPAEPGEPFSGEVELGGWRVRPSLNRLERDGSTVRLEPKMMDVLAALARRAGEVVSKDELSAAVWPDVFVTDSVITRAIAGLRRALDDDARAPRFIETIAKRGYRLVAVPRRAGGGAPPASPWSPGQWVRGERFHGRGEVLAEVLAGPRNALWLLGSRAIGKTSALKQLEHLCAGGERGFWPLFWDLQGSDDPEHLDRDFAEALADAGERLEEAGIAPGEVAADGFLPALGRLRRALAARGLTLLLLIDEAEELLALQQSSPGLLRKLRRALVSSEGIRTVLASSSRLWRLSDRDQDTSPFLHGFAPPVYLGCLDDEAARRLVAGGGFDEATAAGLLALAGGHPFLLQLLGARCADLGDLERAAEAVAADAAVHRFFAVDLDLLSPAERSLALALAGREGGDGDGDDADPAAALHLERLGFVRRNRRGGLEVRSPILRRWLAEHAARS